MDNFTSILMSNILKRPVSISLEQQEVLSKELLNVLDKNKYIPTKEVKLLLAKTSAGSKSHVVQAFRSWAQIAINLHPEFESNG